MLLNKPHDFVDLNTAETARTFEDQGIKPKFRDSVFTPHMDVRGLTSIQRHKEEAIPADSQNSWHSVPLYLIDTRLDSRVRLTVLG